MWQKNSKHYINLQCSLDRTPILMQKSYAVKSMNTSDIYSVIFMTIMLNLDYDVECFFNKKNANFQFSMAMNAHLIRSCVNFRCVLCAIFYLSWFRKCIIFSAYEGIHKFHADFQWKSTHCIRKISTISLFGGNNQMENVQMLAPTEL